MGTKTASEDELEASSSACECTAVWFGFLVVVSVIAELVIAGIHPAYDAPLQRWGSPIADLFMMVGIVGEILSSMRNNSIQTELRGRSNARVEAATKAAGEAHERAATAERETVVVKRQLKRWVEPRIILDRATFLSELEGLRTPLTVELFCVRSPAEPLHFGYEMYHLLTSEARWPTRWPVAIELTDRVALPSAIPTFNADRPSSGIRLWMSPADKENSDAVSQVSALRSAIEKEIGVTMADAREDVSPGTLQVVIFPKA